MSELQINLIALTAAVFGLMWNRRRTNRQAMNWRVSRALLIWMRHGDVYFNWDGEGFGR